MKHLVHILIAVFLAAGTFACGTQEMTAQPDTKAEKAKAALAQGIQPINDLPNPYETIRNWGTLPEGRVWGATSAIDVDRDGKSIWVAERCGKTSCAGSDLPVVLKLDASGKVVESFGGRMFIFPHGIHVDRDGNVWITDARAATADELAKFPDAKGKGHQVVKFSPQGKVLLTIGKPGMEGDPPDYLNEPCDVVTAPVAISLSPTDTASKTRTPLGIRSHAS